MHLFKKNLIIVWFFKNIHWNEGASSFMVNTSRPFTYSRSNDADRFILLNGEHCWINAQQYTPNWEQQVASAATAVLLVKKGKSSGAATRHGIRSHGRPLGWEGKVLFVEKGTSLNVDAAYRRWGMAAQEYPGDHLNFYCVHDWDQNTRFRSICLLWFCRRWFLCPVRRLVVISVSTCMGAGLVRICTPNEQIDFAVNIRLRASCMPRL